MGSYRPRHLKHEPNALVSKVVGRKSLAAIAGAAVIVPSATAMTTAEAAPVTAPAAVSVAAAAHTASLKTARFTTNVRTLYYGSRGSMVRVVQKRLGHLAVDGIFGPRTRAAVRHFQRSHRLVVDGIVGPHTWYALGGYPGGSSAPVSRSGGHSTSAAVNVAERYLGVPYRWGGESPSGFDCSGFVQYVYRQLGHYLPRTASAQQRATYRVSSPRPGDLVFYGTPAYHVGIYIGHGKTISARKPGTVVSITNAYWGAYSFHRVG